MPRAKKPVITPHPTTLDAFLSGAADAFAGGEFGAENARPFVLMTCLTLAEVDPVLADLARKGASKPPSLSETHAFAFAVTWTTHLDVTSMDSGLRVDVFQARQSKLAFAHPLSKELGIHSSSSYGSLSFEECLPGGGSMGHLPRIPDAPVGAWLRPCVALRAKPTPAQTLQFARDLCALAVRPWVIETDNPSPFVLLASEAGTDLADELASLGKFIRDHDRKPGADAWLRQVPRLLASVEEARALSLISRGPATAAPSTPDGSSDPAQPTPGSTSRRL